MNWVEGHGQELIRFYEVKRILEKFQSYFHRKWTGESYEKSNATKIQIHGNESPLQSLIIQRLNFHHFRAQVQYFFEILVLDKKFENFSNIFKLFSQTQNFLHF